VAAVEERKTLRQGDLLQLHYPGETIKELLDPQGILEDVTVGEEDLAGVIDCAEGSGVFFLKMCKEQAEYIRPVKVRIEAAEEKKKNIFRNPGEEFEGPHTWEPICMDALFNACDPLEIAKAVLDTAESPAPEYNQTNIWYYKDHLKNRIKSDTQHPISDKRWRSMVDENGIVMTGEGIPFRSHKEGCCMAATTMAAPIYPESVTAQVDTSGRAAYLLVTGVTFPMQSHVENLRVTIVYEDGIREEYPLINPYDIGDMWDTEFGRYHDTPGAGFENISGNRGALSSTGLDLTSVIPTDTEAHILRFLLRQDVKVKEIEMRTIANDAIYALMGITILK